MITSCTSPAPMPALSIAALIAALPSCTAERGDSGQLRVAGRDRSVVHALADQAADPLVDLGLELLDVAAHRRRQVLVLGAHHAPAELGADRLPVVAEYRAQALARRRLELSRGAEGGADLLDAGHEALEEQLLLARDVVVDGGLGHLERGGNVVERGVVIALAVEFARRGTDHGLALELPVAPPLAARPPRPGARRAGCCRSGGRRGGAGGRRGAAA